MVIKVRASVIGKCIGVDFTPHPSTWTLRRGASLDDLGRDVVAKLNEYSDHKVRTDLEDWDRVPSNVITAKDIAILSADVIDMVVDWEAKRS